MPTQIDAWLDRSWPLPKRFSIPAPPDIQGSQGLVWLAVEQALPLHKALSADWRSLRQSTERVKRYVADAIVILGSDQVEEEGDKRAVIAALGPPPSQALPIYIITVTTSGREEIAYIGKTTGSNRFSGGHSVALKLHNPVYAEAVKTVYRCSVTVLIEPDNVALEWIDPFSTAAGLLNDIESRLIYEYQPSLNTHKKLKNLAKDNFLIHIQNLLSEPDNRTFLSEEIL